MCETMAAGGWGIPPFALRGLGRREEGGGGAEIPAFNRLLGGKFGYDRLRPLNPCETIVGGQAIRAGE
jgi:hypothetical protein